MAKQKYDREKIKMEFMLSDFDEVKWFIGDIWVKYNSKIATITKWWTKEKQEYKKKIYEKALKKKWNETAKEISRNAERLEMLNDRFIDWMEKEMEENERKPAKGEKKRKLFSNDIMNMRKISRTERWLPTNISKTENTNKEERNDLSDDEVQALKSLLKKK